MKTCTILTYHIIDEPRSSLDAPWCCTPSAFKAQMRYLKSSDYTVISLSKMLDCMEGRAECPEKPVVITVDDGMACFFQNACPVLAELGLPATLFMVAGFVGKENAWMMKEGYSRRPMMSVSEVQQSSEMGIDIGSHTMTHLRLGSATPREQAAELRESKDRLEDILSRSVPHFAYPHGSYNEIARNAVEAAGYRAACSTISGKNLSETDRYLLRRVAVMGGDSLWMFRLKVRLGMTPYSAVRIVARTMLARANKR